MVQNGGLVDSYTPLGPVCTSSYRYAGHKAPFSLCIGLPPPIPTVTLYIGSTIIQPTTNAKGLITSPLEIIKQHNKYPKPKQPKSPTVLHFTSRQVTPTKDP